MKTTKLSSSMASGFEATVAPPPPSKPPDRSLTSPPPRDPSSPPLSSLLSPRPSSPPLVTLSAPRLSWSSTDPPLSPAAKSSLARESLLDSKSSPPPKRICAVSLLSEPTVRHVPPESPPPGVSLRSWVAHELPVVAVFNSRRRCLSFLPSPVAALDPSSWTSPWTRAPPQMSVIQPPPESLARPPPLQSSLAPPSLVLYLLARRPVRSISPAQYGACIVLIELKVWMFGVWFEFVLMKLNDMSIMRIEILILQGCDSSGLSICFQVLWLISSNNLFVHVKAWSVFRQVKIVSVSFQSRTKKTDFIPSLLKTMVLAITTTIGLCLGSFPPSSIKTPVWVISNRCEPPDPPVPPDPPPHHPQASFVAHLPLPASASGGSHLVKTSIGFIFLTPWISMELSGLRPIARLVLFRRKFLSLSLSLYEIIRLDLCYLLPLNEDHLTALCRLLPRIEDHFTALCRPLPRIEDLDTLPLYEDFVTLPLYEDLGSFVEFFTPLYSPFVSNDCVARGVITGSFVRCLIASVAILEIGNCALVAVPISGVRSSTQDFTLLNNSIVEEIRGLLQDLYLFKCYVVIIPFSFSTYVIVISAYYAFVVMLSTNTYSFYGD